jgi:hypothetical protein
MDWIGRSMLELGRSRVDGFLSSVVIVRVEQRTQNTGIE